MSRSVPGMFSAELKEAVKTAKILIVGAGGIGSEILKNVVLTGFQDITIIDLDTIDVSNLNRQFLFHKEHVGMPKSIVARDSALKFNPDVKIHAYHDNITKQDYNMNFFKTFTLVMNALDNRQARNHVNRMCLAADVPLIESGTAGFNGQVELIKKNVSSCYECTPKMGQRTYPSCTIRNTPSEPVHCIVWAKHLFNQLFGNYTDEEDVTPSYNDNKGEKMDEDGQNGNKVTESSSKSGKTAIPTRVYAEKHQYDGETMFSKLFTYDIQYLLKMGHLWENRKPPIPLHFATYEKLFLDNEQNNENIESKNMIVWTIEKSVKMFLESLKVLRDRKIDGNQYLVWDKDDNAAMDFVAACANIRAHIFGIEMQSRFQIKSIAGNIIPAIASSNAIVAAVVVLRSLKVLLGEYESCPTVYLREFPTTFGRRRILVPEKKLIKPNPKCCVCSEKNEVNVIVDLDKTTMVEFRDQVLVKSLNMIAPDIILADKNAVILSSEEGETDYNNEKSLREVGIIHGSILKVDDFLQNYELNVIVTEQAQTNEEEPLFKLVYDSEKLQEALKPKNDSDAIQSNGISTTTNDDANGNDCESNDDDDDDSFKCIETTVTDNDLCEELVTPTKKVRLSNANPDPVDCQDTDNDIITL